jgi:hypothetical protein
VSGHVLPNKQPLYFGRNGGIGEARNDSRKREASWRTPVWENEEAIVFNPAEGLSEYPNLRNTQHSVM